MSTTRLMVLIGAATLFIAAAGFLVFHYVATTSQFVRLIMTI